MAFGNRDKSDKSNGQNTQKADVILELSNQISAKIDALAAKVNHNSQELEKALSKLGKGGRSANSSDSQIYDELHEEYNSLKREMTYISAQNERIFVELSTQIKQLAAAIGGGEPVIASQLDYDLLASKIAERMPAHSSVSPVPVYLQYSEELADRIALKIGALKSNDFDILVDDDGCSTISDSIVEKLNYDVISAAISEKLRAALGYLVGKEPDYDEMAAQITQRIASAAVLSNNLPEIDTDEIADKVVSQLLGNMPAAEIDSEAICKNISEKLKEAQENTDYDIVLDEEGLNKITEYVADEIRKTLEVRSNNVESQLSELKEMLKGGAALHVTSVTGETVADDPESAGVDFENMMKYNRSFIARIIQSTDEQKEYYGRVKTTLLSYSKVNSNVAWGAERFNKGRETVARLKIRGKTLCLYLALDPKDYEYSVYHHVDVSDNKSMHGTPMMIKIKSPRGVKKAIRLIDDMLTQKNAVKRTKSIERNYAEMYPYESIEELIADGLVKDVGKTNK